MAAADTDAALITLMWGSATIPKFLKNARIAVSWIMLHETSLVFVYMSIS